MGLERSEINDRVIGKYTGEKEGPLLIVFGGMHGNEPAGVKALEMMFKMLEVEPVTNPDFVFKGTLLGIIGNLAAYKKGKRYINRDLNRLWRRDNVERISLLAKAELNEEEVEIKEILDLVKHTINTLKPQRVFVLDLHTTSSTGGIFSIPNDEENSLKIALELHAPVILGMLNGIKGTTLHYFTDENFDVPITAVTFESGQHTDPLSINRAIAGLTNCMRTIGCVDPAHIENQHDKILIEYSKDLPKVARLIDRHNIEEGDNFEMLPGFENFQAVKKEQILATDRKGIITAPDDALILMPLYQKQGEDGFFLVKEQAGY